MPKSQEITQERTRVAGGQSSQHAGELHSFNNGYDADYYDDAYGADYYDDYGADYDDGYGAEYDDFNLTSGGRGGGGGKGGGGGRNKGKSKGVNVYSSRHTRLQAEQKASSKTKRK